MYFVVFLIEPIRYAVVPCYWIYDPNNELWDKFVNTGLNSSQNYLCYWASERNSENYLGSPIDVLEPDFAASRASFFPCLEGTYTCRIVKFKCTSY